MEICKCDVESGDNPNCELHRERPLTPELEASIRKRARPDGHYVVLLSEIDRLRTAICCARMQLEGLDTVVPMESTKRVIRTIDEACSAQAAIEVSDRNSKSPITELVKALLSDPEYWMTWKANIAMQFQDAFARDYRSKGVYEISNDAAQEFLLLLVQHSTANSALNEGEKK